MANKKGHSKFGTAVLQEDGYYRIASKKQGNYGKRLHRLIFEDFYGYEIPDGFVIHHKNGIKTDNCILNLQMMKKADHHSIHAKGNNNSMYGKHHTNETKQKISKNHAKYWKGKHISNETKAKLSKANIGTNHPQAKYTLWDIECVGYHKGMMFRGNEEGKNPRRCFELKYKGKHIPIGGYNEFESPRIIYEIIKKQGDNNGE